MQQEQHCPNNGGDSHFLRRDASRALCGRGVKVYGPGVNTLVSEPADWIGVFWSPVLINQLPGTGTGFMNQLPDSVRVLLTHRSSSSADFGN